MTFGQLLDDRFEAVGAEAHRMAPARLALAVVLTLVAGFAIGWQVALTWSSVLLANEAWGLFLTRRLADGGSTPAERWRYFLSTWIGVGAWTAFGLILWLAPRPACQLVAVAFWAGQLLYAQNFCVKSPVSLVQIGLPSALAPLTIPLLFPRFSGLDEVILMTILVLCVVHAVNASYMNMIAARDLDAATRLTLQSKEQAEAAHGWLTGAVEAMNEAVAFFDESDRLVLWNEKYRELVAPGSQALAGGARASAVVAALLGRDIAAAQSEARDAGSNSGELASGRQIQLEDGRWIRIDNRELPNGARALMAVDITDVKLREQSFRLLFDANPVPMLVLDPESRTVLLVNETLIRQFGYALDAVAGIDLTEFFTPEDRPDIARRLGERTRDNTHPIYNLRDAQGRTRRVQPYMQPLQFNERDAYICALLDVTDRLDALDALATARDAAEDANRAKSEFLANMSHEIRTPLNGVMGVAGALRRTRLNARQTEMLRVIEDSADALQILLSDILDLARVEAGKLEISPEPCDLRQAVLDIADLFRAKAEEKGLWLRVDIARDLDPSLMCDKTRVKQILGNLLSNAVKFTASGAVDLSVRAQSLPDGQREIRFTVKDTGIGFDEAVRDRLFSRFVQADGSITRRFGGTGLGLSISGALADLMNGAIAVESTPGRGSVFTLTLPMAVADRPAAPAAAPMEQDPEFGQEQGPLRILAAEDHEVNRRVLQLIFEGLDVEITMAENGQEAVDLFGASRFDLILMDMQMPIMDGLQAIQEIRTQERDRGLAPTPVVVLTANALPEHEAAGFAVGADAFVTKPVSAQSLLETIQETLSEAARRQAA